MSRLVIVSNRIADLRKPTQTGGLAVGLADALKQRGGLWFGWDGQKLRSGSKEPQSETVGKVVKVSFPLTDADYAEYYIGYSNSVLWPLCHYRLDLVDFRTEFFDGYRRVNEKFADVVAPRLEPDDVVWVHDYHLIPLAQALRRKGCAQRIGFFLHIPFPPPDLLAASPNHSWLVESMLDYDLIGFQTEADLANFTRYIEGHTAAELLDGKVIRTPKRVSAAGSFPIGIDVSGFRAMATRSHDDVQIDRMRRSILGRQQMIGVDRLDYSKGLPDRFRAFRRLLELYPPIRKTVTLLQIAPPTREDLQSYADIRRELEGLTGAINGRFSDFNWTPIRYLHRNVPRDKLAALFRASQVGVVTPLRDGMNLVAKEYVAAQNEEDPGVLVLSRFAGAAEELEEALIVNPFNLDEVAGALHLALRMPLPERQERHQALFARISRQDARAWLTGFLEALEKQLPEAAGTSPDPHRLKRAGIVG